MPTSVLLIRHGEYHHTPSPAGEAASDGGLTASGWAQAQALRDRLAHAPALRADALYSSTLPRAVQTAACIAPAWALAPVALPALCEWESGNEALGVEAFMKRFDALAAAERRQHRFHPGCETIAEFAVRVQTALDEIVARHEGQTVALVVHGGVVEAAFSHFVGFGRGPFEGGFPAVDHTSLTLWRRGASARDEWVQVFANDTHHLRTDNPPTGAVAAGVGVLVVRGGRVLLGRRRGAHGAGTWSAPGGRLAYGETFAGCARRELQEETGLVLHTALPGPATTDVFDEIGTQYVTAFVIAPDATGDPITREPHKCEGWHWHDWDALPQPLFAPLSSLVASGFRPPGL
jgi:8-oxo-dGTP diphosphatase